MDQGDLLTVFVIDFIVGIIVFYIGYFKGRNDERRRWVGDSDKIFKQRKQWRKPWQH